MNIHERNIISETVHAVITGYRSGPWSNKEVADYLMKALDGKGLFKDPLAPVKEPSTTSETMSGSAAMGHVTVECDGDDEYPYLYCAECGDGLGSDVVGQYLSYLIVKAAEHWKESHQ